MSNFVKLVCSVPVLLIALIGCNSTTGTEFATPVSVSTTAFATPTPVITWLSLPLSQQSSRAVTSQYSVGLFIDSDRRQFLFTVKAISDLELNHLCILEVDAVQMAGPNRNRPQGEQTCLDDPVHVRADQTVSLIAERHQSQPVGIEASFILPNLDQKEFDWGWDRFDAQPYGE